jgi:hypothetical protein
MDKEGMLPESSAGDQQAAREGGQTSYLDANEAAQSSGAAEDAKGPRSVLDVVRAMVADGRGAEQSSSSGRTGREAATPAEGAGQEAAGRPAAAAGAEEGKAGEEDDSRLPFHNHPRWKQVLGERDAFRRSHEMLGGLERAMVSSGVAPEEFRTGVEIMALMRTDPASALARLAPYVDALREVTGDILPEDLGQDLDKGAITEGHAKELARLRQRDALSAAKAEEGARHAHALMVHQAVDAITGWERQWLAKDPDYARKQPFVSDAIKAVIRERGFPSTVAETVRLANEVRGLVERRLQGLGPRRQEVLPVRGAGTSQPTRPEPNSTLDVIRMIVGQ